MIAARRADRLAPGDIVCARLPYYAGGALTRRDVVRVDAGPSIVVVRFADDGSERRLMLEYAPLEKIG